MPLFTVVIPIYNRSHLLHRAIASVQWQTFTDYEIWIVDDGSEESLRDLVKLGPRINYVRQANAGVASARNTGIERSGGDFIAFLDADDWWYPDKLQQFARATMARPNAGLYYSQAHVVDDQGHRLWTYESRAPGRNPYRSLLAGNFIVTSTVVVPRHIFTDVGLFDTRLKGAGAEDWDLWLRIARVHELAFVAQPLTSYEFHISHGRLPFWATQVEVVLKKALQNDPSVGRRVRHVSQSAAAYTVAKAALAAGLHGPARRGFLRAMALNPFNWKACAALCLSLSARLLDSRLSRQLRSRFRLPAPHGPGRVD